MPVKIWFSDMWKGFDLHDNYFTIYLSQYFDIKLDPNPDFLIHSVYSKNYLKYKCWRICISGENTRPDFSKSDFHLGFDFNDNPSYLRWPLFLMNQNMPECLLNKKDINSLIASKTRFCSFVVSNVDAKQRIEFFQQLSRYKQVDSGGRYLNNIGGPVQDKHEFLKSSKFNIAFENIAYPGYTSEKIFDAFRANCIPIYWGNPKIGEDFNVNAFINVHDFDTTESLIEHIKSVDENEQLYKNILQESAFRGNVLPKEFQISNFIGFFDRIFSNSLNKQKVYRSKNIIEFLLFKIEEKLFDLRVKFVAMKIKYAKSSTDN